MIDAATQQFIREEIARQNLESGERPGGADFHPHPHGSRTHSAGDATNTELIQRMIDASIGRLLITGPGVTGGPRSGWAINPPPPLQIPILFSGNITVCVEAPPGTFTQKTALYENGALVSVS